LWIIRLWLPLPGRSKTLLLPLPLPGGPQQDDDEPVGLVRESNGLDRLFAQ